MVAHSSLVTVTIDSLTRSRPLIRDAIDSREGENRAEGVRIREENSPPLFNQKIVDEDVKNFRVEIVRSLFLRNRESFCSLSYFFVFKINIFINE